ncbi:hypothetical protein COU61_04450 [Candidatus Pacearchaeota archaeon CG10_big_fil_rev_8_21_14_0_10_35_13]|nr:MAG: hypothetical protein COU61_04450 [Candidatus Pacearchaeota archaeon CG10_big_fil_rev_8_21_14_0_10_35_13]
MSLKDFCDGYNKFFKWSFPIVTGCALAVIGSVLSYDCAGETNRTRKLVDDVYSVAAGDDSFLDDSEKLRLVRDLGLTGVLQSGEFLKMRIPAFSPRSIVISADDRDIGTVDRDVLEDYLEKRGGLEE